MEWHKDTLLISDDPDRLDFAFIVTSLQQTYWAKDRPTDTIIESWQYSTCFGVYDGDTSIGFARAVTDYVTFSWIADVFIHPAYRGRGIAKWMMQCILEHPDIKDTKQILATRDAHGLYEKVGFVRREMLHRNPTDQ